MAPRPAMASGAKILPKRKTSPKQKTAARAKNSA